MKNLKQILLDHELWIKDNSKGIRANLCGANLCGANLYGANLYGANLSGADLSGANLSGANLYGANLYGANLCGADLHRANLSGANLHRANLYRANLSGADLHEANLHGANLYGADLREANLHGANLHGANLHEANLREANLHGANLPSFQLCAEGILTVYKKASNKVVELKIVEDIKRTSSLVGRKCRAESAEVIRIWNLDHTLSEISSVIGDRDRTTIYTVGSTVTSDKYDDDIRVECTHGIHFFITFEEAANY